VDQSKAIQAITNTYGCSDNTQPNFNRSRYVRHASVYDPRDLGVLTGDRLVIEGLVGAESGTQTLFFTFRLEEQTQLLLALSSTNQYTRQYISFSIRGPSGDVLPLPVADRLIPASIPVITFYVDPGYWDDEYTRVEIEPATRPLPIQQDSDQGQPAGTGGGGEPVGPGVYTLLISSSQWPQLPFRLELAAVNSVELSAEVGLRFGVTARTGLTPLSALLAASLELEGRVGRAVALAGSAGFSVDLVGGIRRIS
jgi:hypothetical protein